MTEGDLFFPDSIIWTSISWVMKNNKNKLLCFYHQPTASEPQGEEWDSSAFLFVYNTPAEYSGAIIIEEKSQWLNRSFR